MVWEPGEEAWENKLAVLRSYRWATGHLAPRQDAMGELPAMAGAVVVQGEDLGRWVAAQRVKEGWGRLVPAQRMLLESLGIELAAGGGHDAKWALGLRAAARAFHACEGHLRVPRKHVEHLVAEPGASDRQGAVTRLW
ncbi:helicase associated domain-containing protein [Streptomyces sp. NPDC006435]|uniref:helicase associated domain-containing protein n=1 Tax=Streptomyces sp. NPDC006435 TaxID=3154300 RepID=UPI0033B83932